VPRNTQVTIDTEAIRHNLSQVKAWAPHSKVMAVVKADAYGHRLDLCVPALKGADLLAVATLEEARAIRRLGINQGIVLLEGVAHFSDLAMVEELDLELVVHHSAQVDALEQYGRSPSRRIWIKVNTGMNRLGLRPLDARVSYQRLSALSGLKDIHWISHFANSESDPKQTQEQVRLFDEATAGLAGAQCLANSAAIIQAPETQRAWVRAGIVLYGVSPLAGQTGEGLGLKPAMRVEAELIAVNQVEPGERVGYGGRFVVERPSVLGVASIGYGDGYPRAMRDGAPVLVRGQPATLAGRVSMDMITLDLSGVESPAIGDTVQLWGPELPVEKVAEWADTIPYELVCRMTRRVRYNMAP